MEIHIIKPDSTLWPSLTSVGEEINPVTKHLLSGILLEENKKYVARIICYKNPHHKHEGKIFMSVGYLYVEENFEHFTSLMEAANQVAKENNFEYLLGPINGNTWNSYRLVTSNQDNAFLLELSTPAYLTNYFNQTDWKPIANYYSQHSNILNAQWDKLSGRHNAFRENGVRFINFDTSKAEELFKELANFCNESFSKNFLFSPIEEADFVELMKPTIQIIDPELTIIARNSKNDIVGFIFAYQDLLNSEKKTLVIKTLARKPSSEYKGIGSVLTSLVIKRAIDKKFEACIHALMIDTNVSTHISNNFQANKFREYALFSKKVVI